MVRALLVVIVCVATASSPSGVPPLGQETRVRQYFVAAEEVTWDFAPSRRNLVMADHLNAGMVATYTIR